LAVTFPDVDECSALVTSGLVKSAAFLLEPRPAAIGLVTSELDPGIDAVTLVFDGFAWKLAMLGLFAFAGCGWFVPGNAELESHFPGETGPGACVGLRTRLVNPGLPGQSVPRIDPVVLPLHASERRWPPIGLFTLTGNS
jgi:hypothetical protein